MSLQPEIVTSFANPTVKRFKALAARKYRRREGAFTVEGLQPVWRAVEASRTRARWHLATLLVAPDLLTNEPAWQMVDEAERGGTRVVRVSDEVFEHLSDRDGPAGLAAIVSGQIGALDAFEPRATGPIVALHEVGNPGNIGAILRSADAAGAAGLLLVGQTADPLAPSAVKASMGSLFAVPTARVTDVIALQEWARAASRPVVAITGYTDGVLWDAGVDARAVLLFGSEGDGLPPELVATCDEALAIPMSGTAESLNLATAASITLFELARRRHVKAGPAGRRRGPQESRV